MEEKKSECLPCIMLLHLEWSDEALLSFLRKLTEKSEMKFQEPWCVLLYFRTIRTKYYEADVQFESLSVSDSNLANKL